MDLRVISIGALSAHPLRDEDPATRTGHATTTLIRSGDACILVDPSLPAEIIIQRLDERVGLAPDNVTHVFLTSFNPELRRGLAAFDNATWWISAEEREAVGVPLAESLRLAHDAADVSAMDALENEVAVLHRCEPAPESLAAHVDLYPMPGVTPGLSGLIVSEPARSTVVCGDAIATIEHLLAGQVLPTAFDVGQAQESFSEAIEIADLLVLGRDNLVSNPTKSPF